MTQDGPTISPNASDTQARGVSAVNLSAATMPKLIKPLAITATTAGITLLSGVIALELLTERPGRPEMFVYDRWAATNLAVLSDGKNETLYGAGYFYFRDGRASAGHAENAVVIFDGADWKIQTPVDGPVVQLKSVTHHGQQQLVLGILTEPGDSQGKGVKVAVALYDGKSSVRTIGTIDGWLRDVLVWKDTLVITGGFSSVDKVSTANIALWDGATWHDVGGGVSYSGEEAGIYSAGVFQESLVVAGNFDKAGTQPCNGIALWDGNKWNTLRTEESLKTGNRVVRDMVAFDNCIYIASHPALGSVAPRGSTLSKWADNEWSTVTFAPSAWMHILKLDSHKFAVYSASKTAAAVTTIYNADFQVQPGIDWNFPKSDHFIQSIAASKVQPGVFYMGVSSEFPAGVSRCFREGSLQKVTLP